MQALDASLVVSERHIAFAAKKAFAAMSRGRNVAKDPGVEIMRYASGERQIERAMAMGISDSTERVALILAAAKDDCRWPTPAELSSLLVLDESGCHFEGDKVREMFGISAREIEVVGEDRIEELVIERVALVDTYR